MCSCMCVQVRERECIGWWWMKVGWLMVLTNSKTSHVLAYLLLAMRWDLSSDSRSHDPNVSRSWIPGALQGWINALHTPTLHSVAVSLTNTGWHVDCTRPLFFTLFYCVSSVFNISAINVSRSECWDHSRPSVEGGDLATRKKVFTTFMLSHLPPTPLHQTPTDWSTAKLIKRSWPSSVYIAHRLLVCLIVTRDGRRELKGRVGAQGYWRVNNDRKIFRLHCDRNSRPFKDQPRCWCRLTFDTTNKISACHGWEQRCGRQSGWSKKKEGEISGGNGQQHKTMFTHSNTNFNIVWAPVGSYLIINK